MYDNFDNIIPGDKVVFIQNFRASDRIVKVTRITPKQFMVGNTSFWKKNGLLVGRGTYSSMRCRFLEQDDATRIAAETLRKKNSNTYSEHRVRDFNDDELARVAAIIKECNTRRNLEAEKYAEENS